MQLLRSRDAVGDELADIIDMLTMHLDERRKVVRWLSEIEARCATPTPLDGCRVTRHHRLRDHVRMSSGRWLGADGLREAAAPVRLVPGTSTAGAAIVDYRLGKLQRLGLLTGNWLDCGCAEGGYVMGLLERGVSRVTGVDVGQERIEEAQKRCSEDPRATFKVVDTVGLPFDDASFDGVLLNEVLEHVEDENATLSEIARVLKRGGYLALFSPNRWFPIEGHGIEGASGWEFDHPTPLVPWLPDRWTAQIRRARNYWPSQAVRLVRLAGLNVTVIATAFPQFEIYPWMPRSWIPHYRRLVPRLESTPIVRWLGVSVFIVAQKP